MRIKSSKGMEKFDKYLENIGNGLANDENDNVEIRENFRFEIKTDNPTTEKESLLSFIDLIFPGKYELFLMWF